ISACVTALRIYSPLHRHTDVFCAVACRRWRGVGGEDSVDFLLHPSFWPQQIINGVLIGGIYVLVALGFSIVWGILNIVNLAHGVFIMLGAFVTFFIWDATGLDPFLVLPFAAVVLFIIGYATQAGIINFV